MPIFSRGMDKYAIRSLTVEPSGISTFIPLRESCPATFLPSKPYNLTVISISATECLKIEGAVHLVVTDDHHLVMRRQRFFVKHLGQPVVRFGKARLAVEIQFRLENAFAQCGPVVLAKGLAQFGRHHLAHIVQARTKAALGKITDPHRVHSRHVELGVP